MQTNTTSARSVYAENAILAILMIAGTKERFEAVKSKLKPDDFYSEFNQKVYAAILSLGEKNRSFDVISVFQEYKKGEQLQGDELVRISELGDGYCTSVGLESYCRIVLQQSIHRQLAVKLQEGVEACNAGAHDFESCTKLSNEIKEFGDLLIGEDNIDFPSSKTMIQGFFEELQKGESSEVFVPPLGTGIEPLDDLLKLIPGLHILGGRPGMGKTSLALQIAEHVSRDNEGALIFFSMEMPKEKLMLRLFSLVSGVPVHKLLSNDGSLQEEGARVFRAVNDIQKTNIIIFDEKEVGPEQIEAKYLAVKRQFGKVSAVVLDYLQLIKSTEPKETREQEVASVAKFLKQGLADKYNLPVLALGQLNRNIDKRSQKNNKPVQSDLRESGAIEMYANSIFFVHADLPEDPYRDVIIGKQRDGSPGEFRLGFDGKCTRFSSESYSDPDWYGN